MTINDIVTIKIKRGFKNKYVFIKCFYFAWM